MNVLITGHSGFIGGHTADYFTEMGHVVFGVARSFNLAGAYKQYSLDITDFDSLSRLVNEKCIDVIMHFAGKPIVADCDQDPFQAFLVNGLGTAAALDSARYAGVKRVVVVETDKIYGIQEHTPTNEDAALKPGSPYEFSKVLAAAFCEFYRNQYGMNVISVRPVNVFGPNDYSFTRIVPASMRNIFEGKGIPIHEHAAAVHRDFIYVKDVAKMMYLLATEDTQHSIYNLSTNNSMSILEFAKRITTALGHTVDPIIIKKPGNYPEIPFQAIDGSRFLNEFDFTCTPLEEAMVETYREYSEQFNISVL
ncbi:hypothetical protein LCGC14_2102590 [marine sediment metagenome]|uniref:NAD-dependent epimerase/dehydratase domain-containing protein n=1 Tax=marine sediment metagenome TaxID=412755 RepID=A0A0F9GMJ5_9ZZZZ